MHEITFWEALIRGLALPKKVKKKKKKNESK